MLRHIPPSSTEVKNKWSDTSATPYALMEMAGKTLNTNSGTYCVVKKGKQLEIWRVYKMSKHIKI
jgi:hypothetical protein